MLNTTLLQLQQVELQIYQLQGYVREHQLRQAQAAQARAKRPGGQAEALFEAAVVLSEITDAAQAHRAAQEARQAAEDEGFAEADPGEVFARQMQRRMFPLFLRAMVLSFVLRLFELDWYIIFAGNCILFIREYWMIAALTQGGARAGQAGGQAAPQPELRHHLENQQQPMLRQRFSMLFKIALLMFLMEAAYLVVALFFLFGAFDSWIEWFNGNGGNADNNLEHQLDALRRAQNQPQREPQREAQSEAQREPQREPQSELEDAEPPEAPAEAAPPAAPPFWQRFIYQLFIMFFLTLMPWWTPNPRYECWTLKCSFSFAVLCCCQYCFLLCKCRCSSHLSLKVYVSPKRASLPEALAGWFREICRGFTKGRILSDGQSATSGVVDAQLSAGKCLQCMHMCWTLANLCVMSHGLMMFATAFLRCDSMRVISPNSKFRIAWDLFGAWLIYMDAFVLPMCPSARQNPGH
ncbi:Uncharacterized protein SCF082_LOCUS18380 [Durusdinium trenchii]|uniref:Uncharacterized protein n=1 Tax=Durusdinium trenchii TaxID=1381693 RepID=A0ABP0KNP6_9DINO